MSPKELVGTIQQIGKLSVFGSKLCSAGPEHHLVEPIVPMTEASEQSTR